MVYGIIKDEELILKKSGSQGIGSVNGDGLKIGPTGSVKAVILVSDVGAGPSPASSQRFRILLTFYT